MIEPILALLFGLLIGSFLNVCIHRWPRNRSVVKPRSHCVRCRKRIAWHDNIPVLSYLLLRGRCRHCHTRISPRYPVVELLTGLVFYRIFAAAKPDHTLDSIRLCVYSAIVIALIFCDLEKRLLPDEFTKGGIVIGLVFSAFVPVPDFFAHFIFILAHVQLKETYLSIAESACGAFFPSICLWLAGWFYLKLRHRDGLGLGDVKLIAMVGAFLGLNHALFTLIVGSVAGTIIGIAYIKLTGQDTDTYELPFGTFLGAAALLAAIFGQRLLP
jgi:leader peptidase (prepilin peptidase)/N-methyltransferase